MGAIRSGSAALAYDDTGGAGPAVVLLHPGVGDRRCWAATAAALGDGYRVVAYDRRGFGETTYRPEPHDPVADLGAVLDGLGLERAALVGNSMGGQLAIDYTLRAPDRVLALVLVGAAVTGAPTPERLDDALEALFDHVDELEAAGDLDALNDAEARIWLDGPARRRGAVGGPARELFLEMNGRALAAVPPGDAPAPAEPSAWARLGEITVPVLSLVGARDLPHLVARSAAIAARVANGRFVELPDSAHLPQLDDPERFHRVLATFLAEHVPR